MSLTIIKSNFIFTPTINSYEIKENTYAVVENGIFKKFVETLPQELLGCAIMDYSDKFIIPGFVDVHVHAPQFVNRGLGVDCELLTWLETYTFKKEAKYKDLIYAKEAYKAFVKALVDNGTTRSIIFATIHNKATILLMDLIEEAGLCAYVGKINMDRNSPDYYIEDTEQSIKDTEEFIVQTLNKYDNVKPIITPRFVPSCTEKLMKSLGDLADKYDVKIQSHVSENRDEIKFVKALHPDAKNYTSVYDNFGLIRDNLNTVMAHCVWTDDDEMKILHDKKVMIAHSPHSNSNIASGIAPIRKYLDNDLMVGLASDISGGHELFMGKVISHASQVSKLRRIYVDEQYSEINTREYFYIATKGGGKFFSKVGSFETGYEFDALVIDDTSLKDPDSRSLIERLERFIYIGDDRNIFSVYVKGNKIK